LTVTNHASDPDIPVNNLTYQLINPPTGAGIDTNGVITWTPISAQIPSTNIITTVVTDYNPWAVNAQQLSATNSFTVVINEVNMRPTLHIAAQGGSTLSLNWSATTGQTYQVQYKTSMTQLNWSNLGGILIATNGTAAAADSIGPDAHRFYRVVLVP
jgi:hypothetical protein